MQINLSNILYLPLEDGSTIACETVNVFLAVSDSLALQLVPIDDNYNSYPEHSISFVGNETDSDIKKLLDGIKLLINTFTVEKGL